MGTWLVAIAVGIVAGALDIVTMLAHKLEKKEVISAFLHYLFVSIVIINIDLPGIAWWLQGGIISLAFAVPIILLVATNELRKVLTMGVASVVLGTLISLAGYYLV